MALDASTALLNRLGWMPPSPDSEDGDTPLRNASPSQDALQELWQLAEVPVAGIAVLAFTRIVVPLGTESHATFVANGRDFMNQVSPGKYRLERFTPGPSTMTVTIVEADPFLEMTMNLALAIPGGNGGLAEARELKAGRPGASLTELSTRLNVMPGHVAMVGGMVGRSGSPLGESVRLVLIRPER